MQLRPVTLSAAALRLSDHGRCGVLVVRRTSDGVELESHRRSWALPRKELAQELNGCRNCWIDELTLLGPEHPNYLALLALIREMESARVEARERGA